MIEMQHRMSPARRVPREQGFTLLELVVAASIFLVVTGSIYMLLQVGTSDRFTTNQRAEILQSSRLALNVMGKDVINVGYQVPDAGIVVGDGSLRTGTANLGLPDSNDGNPDNMTHVIMRDDNADNGDAILDGTDQVSFLSADDSFNQDANGNPVSVGLNAINPAAPADWNTFTVTAGQPMSAALFEAGRLYVISNVNTARLCYLTVASVNARTITFADDAGTDPMRLNLANTLPVAEAGRVFTSSFSVGNPRIRRVRLVSYFVNTAGTLIQRVHGSGALLVGTGSGMDEDTAFVDMPLVEGVEDLEIEYTVPAGAGTAIRPTAANPIPTQAELLGVRQVRLTLLVRSPEVDRRTGEPYRTSVTATFSTRNLFYSQT